MSKKSQQSQHIIIIAALVAIASSVPIQYLSSAYPSPLLAQQEEQCKDKEDNLIPCPHYTT